MPNFAGHDSFVLFTVGIIISLAVFAINSKVNMAILKSELIAQALELKIDREYLKPAFDGMFKLLRELEKEIQDIRDRDLCCTHCPHEGK